MPARRLLQSPPPWVIPSSAGQPHHNHASPFYTRLVPSLSAGTAAFSILLIITFCFRRKPTKKRSVSDSKPPYRFSYSLLRRATDNFSASRRLGQGGFGWVYSAALQQKNVAVKVMDSGSLQGEREFYNELFFASMIEPKDYVVSVLGFSSDRKRERMLLVYELMSNGNLQDALLRKKCPELLEWKTRFSIAVDIAKAIAYLHSFRPPVIHGDIKPSNILLDQNFSAKIADFGLARLKSDIDNQSDLEIRKAELESNGGAAIDDCGSVAETESMTTTTNTTAFEDLSFVVDQSPESFVKSPMKSPEIVDKSSVESVKIETMSKKQGIVEESRKEGDVKVKDYVIEWIGTEIDKERPKPGLIGGASSSTSANICSKPDKKKKKKRLDWWVSLDEDKEMKIMKNLKKEKRRPAREWWKEEYCEELEKKKKKKKKRQWGINTEDEWWPRDEENLHVNRKSKSRRRSRSISSRGSMDKWLEGLSFDSASGEIPKSGCLSVSSTPSMRGTVCYIAPEYNSGGDLSERCDVYSFGVLLLVLISGRRPLQVTGSPMAEFQRANLISWAKHLARAGKLIELVDKDVSKSVDKEQALISVTVGLLCLQKSPARRPSMQDVVGMLTGSLEVPQLPAEFSHSPPLRYPFKARKKGLNLGSDTSKTNVKARLPAS